MTMATGVSERTGTGELRARTDLAVLLVHTSTGVLRLILAYYNYRYYD